MKALFIGGTGNISSAVSRLAVQSGVELWHLNRGNRVAIPGVNTINADINDEHLVGTILRNHTWDVVVNWVAFSPADIERDFRYFGGKTGQYIFISTASAYQKPPQNYIITESTPLKNPVWDYSQNKIACENRILELYRNCDFPVTIVRPSHTYNTVLPVTIGGWNEYTVIDRMLKGQRIIVQGDGTSLWTITHADDFAVGFLGLMAHRAAIGEAFHITSDEAMSWNYIYETLAEAAGCKADIVHIPSDFLVHYSELHGFPSVRGTLLGDKAYSAVFDNTKIKRFCPAFKAVIPFHEGIRRTLSWFAQDATRMLPVAQTNRFIDGAIETYLRIFD